MNNPTNRKCSSQQAIAPTMAHTPRQPSGDDPARCPRPSKQKGWPILAKTILTSLAAWLGLTMVAVANPVTVPDFSFENEAITPGGNTAAPNVGTNWTASGNGGVYLQDITNTLFTPTGLGDLPSTADGTNYLVENMNGHTAYCWQNIGPLQSNTIYTLTVAVGQSLLGLTGSGEIALVNGTSPFGTILASAPIDNSTLTAGTFADSSLVFTNGYQASGFLTILLEGNSSGSQLCLDNVRLNATPAPQAPLALPVAYSTPSTTVYQGTAVTLTENPAGALPFHYQWLTDNGSGGATFSNVPGANGTNLVVNTSGFTPNTPVEYEVIVTNSFGSSTSAPVALTAITGAPVVLVDTLPSSDSSDVVGSQVTFTASFDGSRPIAYQWQVDTGGGPTPIPGATNRTYTLSNLQLSDSGYYSLTATNELGSTTSTESYFTVYAVPAADLNGVVASPANQVGLGGSTEFTPTWTLATNSLIGGELPVSSAGNFQEESAGGIVPVTQGVFEPLPPEGNAGPGLATCGIVSSGAGSSLVYSLPGSATGFDLTNIMVYGGWSDNGRDEQEYQVYYSTIANPTNFQLMAYVDYLPTVPSGLQSATRVTITSTNSVLARNVAAVQFFFNYLAHAPENAWEGYAQFQVFGAPSAARPISGPIVPASGFDVAGSAVTMEASFSSSAPLTYQWFKDGVAIPGATNTILTLSNLQLSDTSQNPGYSCQASNYSGVASSGACPFLVNAAPGPDSSGVVESLAGQTGGSGTFTPTWTLAAGSLISGALPSSAKYGGGSYSGDGSDSAGGVPFLTDGQFGFVGSANNSTLAIAGNGGGGQALIYTLPAGSEGGYNISSIVSYAGWSDEGRDAQAYTVSYSTVSAPSTFILLDAVDNGAPAQLITGTPNGDRLILTPATGDLLASNVYAVEFDFTTPVATGTQAGNQENGYSGYAELQIFGTPAAPIASMPPSLEQDVLPAAGSDVVGSSVTFQTVFDGTSPISYQWYFNGSAIPGANAPTLTVTNLQTTNSGSYNVVATNSYGTASSSTSTFTVNSSPTPVNGTLDAQAYQVVWPDSYASGNGAGFGFTPTWTLAPGSLIAGQLPSSASGNFKDEDCRGVAYLTAGSPGTYGDDDLNLASIGPAGGTSITYTLTGPASGYNLNEIVLYGGWSDSGRNENKFQVYYSTASNPSTFVPLTSPQTTFDYNPGGAALPNAIRQTVTSATASPLARNVAAVQFTFPSEINNWCGLGQIQLLGTPSLSPAFTAARLSGGKLVVAGSGGTPGSGYTLLSSTNVTLPPSAWTTNSTGVFDGSGGFSNSITIVPSEPSSFFRLRIP